MKRLTPEVRREQTRSVLLEAAAEVFARRGFHGATLDEVADAAGFSKGAVYSNFASKEDLFLALVKQRQDVMLQEFFAAAQQDLPDTAARLAAVSDVYRRLNTTENEWVLWNEFLLYAHRKPELWKKLTADLEMAFAALVAMVEQHLAELDVEPPLSVESLARLYVAVFDGLARQSAGDPEAVPKDLFAELVGFITDAVVALGTKRRVPVTSRSGGASRRARSRSTRG